MKEATLKRLGLYDSIYVTKYGYRTEERSEGIRLRAGEHSRLTETFFIFRNPMHLSKPREELKT